MTTEPRLHWTPSQDFIRQSNYDGFRRHLNGVAGTQFGATDYWGLHGWVVASPENNDAFWSALWDYSGVIGERARGPLFDAHSEMTVTRNRLGQTRINWAENMLLAHRHARSPSQLAVIGLMEGDHTPARGAQSGFLRQMSYKELYDEVAQAAGALKKLGVGPGDCVAAMTPNNAEAIVMVLATASIGAIWSSASPELGEPAVLERFLQLKPKVLLSTDKYRFVGKDLDVLPKLDGIVSKLAAAGLTHVVIVGQLARDRRPDRAGLARFAKTAKAEVVAYPDFLDRSAREIEFRRGLAGDPLWVLFSSGTTGTPKAIIHHHGGMVLAAKQAAFLHADCKPGDVILQITTCGWMMWNSTVAHLGMGMTVIAYDGNPFAPNAMTLWDAVDTYGVTLFSLGPRYLQIIYAGGHQPKKSHSLRTLKNIYSAGSPLKAELYDFIKHGIKDVYINNCSGGTDVCGGFVGGIPVLPIYAGLIQGPWLGIALESWDEKGKRLPDGEEGDMVITKPFPNMPVGFMGDDAKDSRLRDTYFNHYPGPAVWYQGDFVQIEPKTKGVIMQGRSDGVLNPQGVRFGSAEIYAVVEEMKDIVDDCIAVGQKTGDGDERVLLFVKPQAGQAFSDVTVKRIKEAITVKLSRRHVPAKIIDCPEIPYTGTGKRVEVAVKKIVNGAKPSSLNTGALINPKALDFFHNNPDLALSGGKSGVRSRL